MESRRKHTADDGWLSRIVKGLTVFELGIAALATALIFVLVLVQAFQRYLPVGGWSWTGELAQFSLVWLTFAAAGVLVTRDGHIALQVVDNIRKPVVVKAFHVLAHLIVAVIAVLFVRECIDLIDSQKILKSPSMGMPMSWHYVLPMLGFISTAIRSLVAGWVVVRRGVAASVRTEDLAIKVNPEVQP